MSDRRILYATAFLRSLATGMVGVLLGIYLARLQLPAKQIGVVVALGLGGSAVATAVVTLAGDRLGRRRLLWGLSILAVAGGTVAALSGNVLVLGAAAFIGMLNGMGRDRGASLVLEQAILPVTGDDAQRTRLFARYNVLQDAGHALGGLLAGLPSLLRRCGSLGDLPSIRLTLSLQVLLMLAAAALYVRLSPAVEIPSSRILKPVSPQSRRLLWRIGSLFGLDSLAGGLLTTALLAVFFHQRFGVQEGAVGILFAAARMANAFSHFAAGWLALRIGLVNTMVFTHVPSSLLLVTVAFAPNFPVAAALFILREGLVEMDVPTRQSYVMAVVQPEERTFASGITHLVRMGGWAVGPLAAGLIMQGGSIGTPLLIGAAMKVAYDVLLYASFRRIKPPEEALSGARSS